MRYLITGGAGFIGSHLADAIVAAGHDVLVLDDLSTGRYENIAHLEGGSRLQLIVDTVLDDGIVNDCVKEVDAVFHLASAVGVRLILDQPVKSLETMVGGTDVVLRSCARYRRPVLITSTSEVYGQGSKVPFNEEDNRVMGSTSKSRWSYACAKALDECMALAHWTESRLPVVVTRLFNTVGPRQTGQYGMVVPNFVRQALAGQPITVYGDGHQSRCFAHVKDVVGALLQLMGEPRARGQIFNIGSDREISIADLAQKVKEVTGSTSEIVIVPYEAAYGEGFDDMRRRVPDLQKIHALTGYEPQRELDDILRDVMAALQAGESRP